MRPYILPYKAGSASAKAISVALNGIMIKLSGSRVSSQQRHTIINWGNSGANLPPQGLGSPDKGFNPTENVAVAANKLTAFRRMSDAGVSVPEFSTRKDAAIAMLSDGHKVVQRTKLSGNSGDGIVMASAVSDLVDAPLYVKYIKKQDEYRVHVARHAPYDAVVFDVQKKKRSRSVPDSEVNFEVRNTCNGFIFAREGVNAETVPPVVIDQAMKALNALDLNFGAVDIVFNAHEGQAYVLEVNTAPGLVGTTLERYTSTLQELLVSVPITPWTYHINNITVGRTTLVEDDAGDQGQPEQQPEQPTEQIEQDIQVEPSRSEVVQTLQGTSQPPLQEVYCVQINGTAVADFGMFSTKQKALDYIQSVNALREINGTAAVRIVVQ